MGILWGCDLKGEYQVTKGRGGVGRAFRKKGDSRSQGPVVGKNFQGPERAKEAAMGTESEGSILNPEGDHGRVWSEE